MALIIKDMQPGAWKSALEKLIYAPSRRSAENRAGIGRCSVYLGADSFATMNVPPHIPALRGGRAYESLEKAGVVDCRDGRVIATVSQVNAGIVRKDLARIGESRAALKKFTVAQLLDICARAGAEFLNGSLPLGGGRQSPRDYIEALSATSGLPHVMVRRNMAKIHHALTNMQTVLNGLMGDFQQDLLNFLGICSMRNTYGQGVRQARIGLGIIGDGGFGQGGIWNDYVVVA